MDKKQFFLLLMCATPEGAMKGLEDLIEGAAIRPDKGIQRKHRLYEDLHMTDEDILSVLANIESNFGDTSREVFGNNDSWKELKFVDDIINKVVTYVQKQWSVKKKEMLQFLTNDEGVIMALETIAKREDIISDEQKLEPTCCLNDGSLNINSLDAIVIMVGLEYIYTTSNQESMFRKDWRSIRTVQDMVIDIKNYANQRLSA